MAPKIVASSLSREPIKNFLMWAASNTPLATPGNDLIGSSSKARLVTSDWRVRGRLGFLRWTDWHLRLPYLCYSIIGANFWTVLSQGDVTYTLPCESVAIPSGPPHLNCPALRLSFPKEQGTIASYHGCTNLFVRYEPDAYPDNKHPISNTMLLQTSSDVSLSARLPPLNLPLYPKRDCAFDVLSSIYS